MLKQIESTHKGSGIPILFSNLSVLAKTSNIFLGEKAQGKGTTVRATKAINILPANDLNLDSVTQLILTHRMRSASNNTVLWRVKEWSTLSQYHRMYFLSIGSQLITDHSYEHMTSGKDVNSPIRIKIDNCTLICLIAITPLKFQRMITENENWESLASDRFIKFVMLNPFREDTKKFDPKYSLPDVDLTYRELPIDAPLTLTRRAFVGQLTPERAELTSRELINAYCIFEGYETITQKAQIEFYKLFKTYLQLYPQLTFTTDIAKPEQFATGGLRLLLYITKHDGDDLQTVTDHFKVYDKKVHSDRFDQTVRQHADILCDKGLIIIKENSPTTFHIAKPLEEYFEFIRGILN